MDEFKKCTKCKETKKLKEFFKDNSTKDGLRYWCKSCVNKKKKGYINNRRKNDEVFKEKLKQGQRVRNLLNRTTNKIDKFIKLNKEDFIKHLNNNIFNFKYNDVNIEIDHKKPLSLGDSVEEIQKLNHFSNIQLLPSYFNQNIKKNRTDVTNFEVFKWLRTDVLINKIETLEFEIKKFNKFENIIKLPKFIEI